MLNLRINHLCRSEMKVENTTVQLTRSSPGIRAKKRVAVIQLHNSNITAMFKKG